MSNSLFTENRPDMGAMAQATFGRVSRAQQVLLSSAFAAAQTQFAYTRGLMEDVAEALQAGKGQAAPGDAAQLMLSRMHDRTERAIADMRHINDDLRNGLYETLAPPLPNGEAAADAPATPAMAATVRTASSPASAAQR